MLRRAAPLLLLLVCLGAAMAAETGTCGATGGSSGTASEGQCTADAGASAMAKAPASESLADDADAKADAMVILDPRA